MSKEDNLTDFLTDVADAIRVQTGEEKPINPQDFSEKIKNGVMKKGAGDYSIVGNNTEKNKAISEYATAFGTTTKTDPNAPGTIAGLLGYYYSKIDITNKRITIGIAHDDPTPVPCEYTVGDVISIINDAKYDKCSKITAVNGNVITVDSLPFTSVVDVGSSSSFDDYSIYCPAKPSIGAASFGKAAFATGDGCVAGNYATFAAGRDNRAYGHYAAAVGRLNEVGYGGFSYGRGNTNDGLYNIVGGVGNKTSNTNSVAVFGGTNTLNHSDASLVGGSAHNVESSFNSTISGHNNGAYYAKNGTIIGKENYISNSDYSLAIGNQKNSINGGNEDSIVGSRQSHITNSSNSIIIGGYTNNITTTTSGSESAIISSRNSNITESWNSTIFGGENNKINGKSGNHIYGGSNNTIDGRSYSSKIIGSDNTCTMPASTLIGDGLKNTKTVGQIALGKWNKDTSAAFVIGNGTDGDHRSNTLEIDAAGNAKFSGTVTAKNLVLNTNYSPILFEKTKVVPDIKNPIVFTGTKTTLILTPPIGYDIISSPTAEYADYIGTKINSKKAEITVYNNSPGMQIYIHCEIESEP